jgi:hypothetical protein
MYQGTMMPLVTLGPTEGAELESGNCGIIFHAFSIFSSSYLEHYRKVRRRRRRRKGNGLKSLMRYHDSPNYNTSAESFHI